MATTTELTLDAAIIKLAHRFRGQQRCDGAIIDVAVTVIPAVQIYQHVVIESIVAHAPDETAPHYVFTLDLPPVLDRYHLVRLRVHQAQNCDPQRRQP